MAARRAAWYAISLVAALSLPLAGQVATGTVSTPQLIRDVETLASDAMEGRRVGTPGSARARAYITGRFEQAGIRAFGESYEQPFALNGPTPGAGVNVVGVIVGRGTPDSYIAVTAHYDHLGVRGGQIYNGAGDNASGVATLLAVATHFGRNPPDHSILFAALDAEEIGLLGARALLSAGAVPAHAIALNVNIDMVGRDANHVLYATGTRHYPFLKRYLTAVARPPVKLRFDDDVPGGQDWTNSSDHYEFHKLGIPFVYFGVEDREHHHRPIDDAATIQREFLAAAAQTVIAAVERFDANLEAIRRARHPPRPPR